MTLREATRFGGGSSSSWSAGIFSSPRASLSLARIWALAHLIPPVHSDAVTFTHLNYRGDLLLLMRFLRRPPESWRVRPHVFALSFWGMVRN